MNQALSSAQPLSHVQLRKTKYSKPRPGKAPPYPTRPTASRGSPRGLPDPRVSRRVRANRIKFHKHRAIDGRNLKRGEGGLIDRQNLHGGAGSRRRGPIKCARLPGFLPVIMRRDRENKGCSGRRKVGERVYRRTDGRGSPVARPDLSARN